MNSMPGAYPLTRSVSNHATTHLAERPEPFEVKREHFEPEVPPASLYNRPTIKVQQSEIVFSSQGSPRLVSTQGAGPCIIFAVRDRATKSGFFTHAFSYNEVDPQGFGGKWLLEKFKRQLESDRTTSSHSSQGNEIDVYMMGGYSFQSDWMIRSMNDFVTEMSKTLGPITVHEKLKENWVSNGVMDFETGEFYQYNESRDKNTRPLNTMQGVMTSLTHAIDPLARFIVVNPQDQNRRN